MAIIPANNNKNQDEGKYRVDDESAHNNVVFTK